MSAVLASQEPVRFLGGESFAPIFADLKILFTSFQVTSTMTCRHLFKKKRQGEFLGGKSKRGRAILLPTENVPVL